MWELYKVEILAKLDIANTYRSIKKTRPSGNGHLIGLCPFHDDLDPSFGFNPKTGA